MKKVKVEVKGFIEIEVDEMCEIEVEDVIEDLSYEFKPASYHRDCAKVTTWELDFTESSTNI